VIGTPGFQFRVKNNKSTRLNYLEGMLALDDDLEFQRQAISSFSIKKQSQETNQSRSTCYKSQNSNKQNIASVSHRFESLTDCFAIFIEQKNDNLVMNWIWKEEDRKRKRKRKRKKFLGF